MQLRSKSPLGILKIFSTQARRALIGSREEDAGSGAVLPAGNGLIFGVAWDRSEYQRGLIACPRSLQAAGGLTQGNLQKSDFDFR